MAPHLACFELRWFLFLTNLDAWNKYFFSWLESRGGFWPKNFVHTGFWVFPLWQANTWVFLGFRTLSPLDGWTLEALLKDTRKNHRKTTYLVNPPRCHWFLSFETHVFPIGTPSIFSSAPQAMRSWPVRRFAPTWWQAWRWASWWSHRACPMEPSQGSMAGNRWVGCGGKNTGKSPVENTKSQRFQKKSGLDNPKSVSKQKPLLRLPYINGMYSACVPTLIYAFFGQSRQLAVGPVAMVSLLVEAPTAVVWVGGRLPRKRGAAAGCFTKSFFVWLLCFWS